MGGRIKQLSFGGHGARLIAISAVLACVVVLLLSFAPRREEPAVPKLRRATRVLQPAESARVLGGAPLKPSKDAWHPPHVVKVWTAAHKGRVFRVTQLPHCRHIETLITYDSSGETVKQAKTRTGGIVGCTGSFHNSQTMALADFLQRNGFSVAFMNKTTDRMAIALNSNFIFIVQGKTDIWRLAHFIAHKLPASTAINCDGGHVVRGKGPVHIVFRWKTASPVKTPRP